MHSHDQNLDDAQLHAQETGGGMVLENVLGLDRSDLDSLNAEQSLRLAREILDAMDLFPRGTSLRQSQLSILATLDAMIISTQR